MPANAIRTRIVPRHPAHRADGSKAAPSVQRQGVPCAANARRRRMIAEGRLLREVGGPLRASSTAADRAIFDHPRSLGGRDGLPADDPAIPLSDDRLGPAGEPPGAVAALFVRAPSAPIVSPREALARRHTLTASEIRVVEATLRLNGLDAIADALGIARSTVRPPAPATFPNLTYRLPMAATIQ